MSDQLRHAPSCPQPGVALERGYSVTVTRCLGCGAITTTRNVHQTTGSKPANRKALT